MISSLKAGALYGVIGMLYTLCYILLDNVIFLNDTVISATARHCGGAALLVRRRTRNIATENSPAHRMFD
jgi:hypothetical protein